MTFCRFHVVEDVVGNGGNLVVQFLVGFGLECYYFHKAGVKVSDLPGVSSTDAFITNEEGQFKVTWDKLPDNKGLSERKGSVSKRRVRYSSPRSRFYCIDCCFALTPITDVMISFR